MPGLLLPPNAELGAGWASTIPWLAFLALPGLTELGIQVSDSEEEAVDKEHPPVGSVTLHPPTWCEGHRGLGHSDDAASL